MGVWGDTGRHLPTLESPQGSWLPSLKFAEVRWGRRPATGKEGAPTARTWCRGQTLSDWSPSSPESLGEGSRSRAGRSTCTPFSLLPSPLAVCQKVWPRAFPRWLLHPAQPSDPKPTPQLMPSCPRAFAQAAPRPKVTAPRSLSTSDPGLGSCSPNPCAASLRCTQHSTGTLCSTPDTALTCHL